MIYGCGGADGWRSIFQQAIDLEGFSETNSVHSRESASRSIKSSRSQKKRQAHSRPVSKLRPKKPMISTTTDSILSMVQMLSNKRGDASLVIDPSGDLAGIITDTDITRRVVAKSVDPSILACVNRNDTESHMCIYVRLGYGGLEHDGREPFSSFTSR